MIMNEDTRIIIGSVVFVLFLVVCVVIAVVGQRAVDEHREQQKAELRRKKEQEAADSYLLDKVEDFRHDFDGYSGPS